MPLDPRVILEAMLDAAENQDGARLQALADIGEDVHPVPKVEALATGDEDARQRVNEYMQDYVRSKLRRNSNPEG